jgi:hypothetical protein
MCPLLSTEKDLSYGMEAVRCGIWLRTRVISFLSTEVDNDKINLNP